MQRSHLAISLSLSKELSVFKELHWQYDRLLL